jgi:diaminopimelate epimerase
MSIKFIKMHGLGNDFIFIDKNDLLNEIGLEFVIKISDRRAGIGCDQLIVYSRISPKLYSMEIYNNDGTSAGMCGNALRCLGLYAFQEYRENELEIIVKERKVTVEVFSEESIRINIGKAKFEELWMPKLGHLSNMVSDYQLNLKEIICVDMGNPHIVIFYDNLSLQEQLLIGQNLQNHSDFIDGVNVNFAKIEKKVISLKVFERGAGFTLACGSGACATFAAANKLKFVEENAIVRFKTGDLHMSYLNENIMMSGPARKIAIGYYNE